MFFFLYIGIGNFICKDASPSRRESPLHKKRGKHLPSSFEPLGGLENCCPAAIIDKTQWRRTPRRESPLHKKEEGIYLPLLSHWADSNRRPTHYECVALPTEPQWHGF